MHSNSIILSDVEYQRRVDEEVQRRMQALGQNINQYASTIQNVQNQQNNNNNLNINIHVRDFDDESDLDTHLTTEFKIACIIEKNLPKLYLPQLILQHLGFSRVERDIRKCQL